MPTRGLAQDQDQGTPGAAPAPSAALSAVTSRWQTMLYGFAKLDAYRDSTQSFADSVQPNLIARSGTYQGDNGRMAFTARDSRLGLRVAAPPVSHFAASAQIEIDFFGAQATDILQNDFYTLAPVRMRHAYLKFDTFIADVLAGQYHDLVGWGGAGFSPATVAFLGVPGMIYHRNPQLRLSKTLGRGSVTLEVAAAAVRPAQRDGELPDAQAGMKLAVKTWSAAAQQGFGEPQLTPLGVAVSGVYRRYRIPEFKAVSGRSLEATARGFVANAVLPVVPVKDVSNRGNALTLTGEFSIGSGIADLYTGMTGGMRFATLPNPEPLQIPPLYPQNIDSGLVTFDRNFNAKTINWRAFVVGLQYYLPIAKGRVWLTVTYSNVHSDNIKALTPIPNLGGVFSNAEYVDGNLMVQLTTALQLGLSSQTYEQTFGDVTQPGAVYGSPAVIGDPAGGGTPNTGGGGKPNRARNTRTQLSLAFLF